MPPLLMTQTLPILTIDHVESCEDLILLVENLGEHSDEESMGVVE